MVADLFVTRESKFAGKEGLPDPLVLSPPIEELEMFMPYVRAISLYQIPARKLVAQRPRTL